MALSHVIYGFVLGKMVLCVDVPEEYGGYGAPVHYSLMLVQETAQAGFASLAVAIGGQNELASPYLQNIGSEEQNVIGYQNGDR